MSDWTVVVPGPADSELAVRLAETHGLTVLATPDIYDLRVGSLTASAINAFAGSVAVAAPYAPRATYWTLSAVGVEGHRADVADGEGKAIHPVDVTGCDVNQAAEKVIAVTGAGPSRGLVRDFHESTAKRWYPIIDYDRCVNCMECVEFCLFGVYEITGAGKVHVAIGDNCKTGCPACSRVCPSGAILFPRYVDGGPIAGADAGRPERLTGHAAREAAAKDVKSHVDKHGDTDHKMLHERMDKAVDDLEAFEP